MSQTFLVPCDNIPQNFSIDLAGAPYQFTVKWNPALEGGWVLDIADTNTGLAIAANIPFITGANMLDGLDYLGIDGVLFCTTAGDQFTPPTLDNLGVEGNLYFNTDVVDG